MCFFLILTVAAVCGGITQHPLCNDYINFFKHVWKLNCPLSHVLCELGVDPDFQLILNFSVCRGTWRPGVSTISSRWWGTWGILSSSGAAYRSRISECRPFPLCVLESDQVEGNKELKNAYVFFLNVSKAYMFKFSNGNLSQCICSLSNWKHASATTEEGFLCLHLKMPVVRCNIEMKKKKSWWKIYADQGQSFFHF